MIIYHGGDINNLMGLLDNFQVLTPEQKMKFPSTGGGNIGLSATRDKRMAKRYSEVFGNDKILSISVDPTAEIYQIDTEGQGLDQFIYDGGELKQELSGYDAVMELDDDAEKEIRILNPDKFKAIRLESITPLTSFMEDITMDDNLYATVTSGYEAIFETITEPMQRLKHSVNHVDPSIVGKLQPYMQATRHSPKEVTAMVELATREWSWFGEAINERWDDDQLNLGDDYPYDIDYENLDIDGLVRFMNDKPRQFDNAVSWFQSNIEGNNTSQVMDYQKPLINKWFVHFSDNAVKICVEGFKYGNDDIEKLALTDAGSTKGKNFGDYLFAYEIDDVMKHAYSQRSRNSFKYGDSAVVFIASGVKFYHHGDEEPQVVFDRKSPTGCFLVRKQDPERDDERSDKWVVYGKKGSRLIPLASKEKFEDAMYWCETNYNQYKKFYRWN